MQGNETPDDSRRIAMVYENDMYEYIHLGLGIEG